MSDQVEIFKARALAILRVIEKGGDVSQRVIAEEIDSSLGTTNQALKALIDGGVVHATGVTTSKGKRGFLYHLTSKGIEERLQMTRDYLATRRSEAKRIADEIATLEAELKVKSH